MNTVSSANLDRAALTAWYRTNRARSAHMFSLVDPRAYYRRPIPLRHPFAFYEGHIPAFSFLTLNERALGEPPVNPAYEKLFERGIDPASIDAAARHERGDWPSREEIQAFGAACDARVIAAIEHAKLEDEANPRLVRAQSVYTILEHEAMHHETTFYIIHQLESEFKATLAQEHRDPQPPANRVVRIGGGVATLGAQPGAIAFGWDNEFHETPIEVPEFGIDAFPVTNGDYEIFVRAGGPLPPFWRERDGERFLALTFEEIPLPRSWPVYATHQQATAYAHWKGAALPSESQFHRAAYGSPEGDERAHPWGNAPPEPRYGNFDFSRYDPEPVDAHPDGASAWGVHDLIGNGWEWTSTPFGPLDGFEPMASYPQYSADFFDGKHYIIKGASPVTAAQLVRRSFRNWFYDDYPYMYAKFRCVVS